MIWHLGGVDDGPPAARDVERVRGPSQGPIAHTEGGSVYGEFDILSLDEKTAANVAGKHNPFLVAGEPKQGKAATRAPLRRSREAGSGNQRQQECADDKQEPAAPNCAEARNFAGSKRTNTHTHHIPPRMLAAVDVLQRATEAPRMAVSSI